MEHWTESPADMIDRANDAAHRSGRPHFCTQACFNRNADDLERLVAAYEVSEDDGRTIERWITDLHVVTATPGTLPAGTVTDHGTIVRSTLTAYEMADGSFVPFVGVHGDQSLAEPLVVLG